MQSRGYSLIEMIVVISVISVLLAIGTLRFNEYMSRYDIAAQTKTIHSELLQAQAAALYERRTTRVKLYQRRLEVYSSARDNADGVQPVRTRAFQYPTICNGSGDGEKGYPLDFDARGIAAEVRTIRVDASGAVDTVVISRTRVRISKKD